MHLYRVHEEKWSNLQVVPGLAELLHLNVKVARVPIFSPHPVRLETAQFFLSVDCLTREGNSPGPAAVEVVKKDVKGSMNIFLLKVKCPNCVLNSILK